MIHAVQWMKYRPMVYFVLSWIIGMSISFGNLMQMNDFWFWIVVSIIFVTLVGAVLLVRANLRWVLIGPFAMMCGLLFAAWSNQQMHSAWPDGLVQSTTNFSAFIAEQPQIDGNLFKLKVLAKPDSFPLLPYERLKLTVRLNSPDEISSLSDWKSGDPIRFQAKVQKFPLPSNFDAFDQQEYERQRGVFYKLSLDSPAKLYHPISPERFTFRHLPWIEHPFLSFRLFLTQLTDAWRVTLTASIQSTFSFDPALAGLLTSMQLGDREAISVEEATQFTQFGLSHVLAISGSNVALWTFFVIWLATRLGFTIETSYKIAMLSVPVYVLITGADASVVRAGVMAFIVLFAQSSHHKTDGVHILAGACWLILMIKPFWILDVGFQLSALVTLGLLANHHIRRGRTQWNWLIIPLLATWLTFPHVVWVFHQFSLFSIPLNILLVPLFGLILTPISAVACLFHLFLSDWILHPILALISGTYGVIEWSFQMASRLEPHPLVLPKPSLPLIWWGMYCLLTVVIFRSLNSFAMTKQWKWFIVFCIFSVYSYQPLWFQSALAKCYGNDLMLVRMLDVGQGDATFLRTPSGFTVLIDAGPQQVVFEAWQETRKPFNAGRDVIVPLLRAQGIHRIDALLLSHGDLDHIGGAEAVLRSFPVGEIWYNGLPADKPAVQSLFKSASNLGVPLIPMHAGMVYKPDTETQFQMLGPRSETVATSGVPQNDASVVMRVEMHHFSVLFTGDLPQTEERKIMSEFGPETMRSTVLKVGHHGSKSSTSEDWLRAVQAQTAFISVGIHNRYHHPNADVIERIQAAGMTIHRTDSNGELQFCFERGKIVTRAKNP